MINNNDLKFPVKFAVLELKRNGGYSTNYEDVTEGFIVSKCYLMESKVRYMANGEQVVSYKVYFPYNNISGVKYFYNHYNSLSSYKEERGRIGINARGDYYPVEIVSDIFDTYEEAKEEAKQKNENLIARVAIYMSISDPRFMKIYERERTEIIARLSVCQKYEDFITENTKDMKVTKDDRLDVLRRLRRKTD